MWTAMKSNHERALDLSPSKAALASPQAGLLPATEQSPPVKQQQHVNRLIINQRLTLDAEQQIEASQQIEAKPFMLTTEVQLARMRVYAKPECN